MSRFIAVFAALMLSSFASVAGAEVVEMQVDGLVCAFCAQGIEKNLRKQAATEDVFVSLEHGLVAVGLKQGAALSDESLRALLQEAGYNVRRISRSDAALADVRKRVAK